MEVKQIIAEIEREIDRLKEARALLAGSDAGSGARRRGRPPGRKAAGNPRAGKRRLSPEGRKRISDALKRRWAARRKDQKAAKAA